jgi:hypothetical protein
VRAISADGRAALYAAQSAEVWLQLLTITHDSIGTPIRLVSNTEAVTSRGDAYLAFPFELAIPATAQESVELIVDNVTRELIDEVRSIDTPLSISLEIVLASAPDTVEAGPFIFQSRSAEYDAQRMRLTLAYEPMLNEPFPAYSYTPLDYPGLFQAVDR